MNPFQSFTRHQKPTVRDASLLAGVMSEERPLCRAAARSSEPRGIEHVLRPIGDESAHDTVERPMLRVPVLTGRPMRDHQLVRVLRGERGKLFGEERIEV